MINKFVCLFHKWQHFRFPHHPPSLWDPCLLVTPLLLFCCSESLSPGNGPSSQHQHQACARALCRISWLSARFACLVITQVSVRKKNKTFLTRKQQRRKADLLKSIVSHILKRAVSRARGGKRLCIRELDGMPAWLQGGKGRRRRGEEVEVSVDRRKRSEEDFSKARTPFVIFGRRRFGFLWDVRSPRSSSSRRLVSSAPGRGPNIRSGARTCSDAISPGRTPGTALRQLGGKSRADQLLEDLRPARISGCCSATWARRGRDGGEKMERWRLWKQIPLTVSF